jgi:Predicted transcriptional regulators
MDNKKYKPKDFARLIGVSVKTLQRWDNEGILPASRTPTNRRYYTHEQYLIHMKGNIKKRKVVCPCCSYEFEAGEGDL